MPRRAIAPKSNSRPHRDRTDPVRLHTWVLSAKDFRVHALADPCVSPFGELLLTRCGIRCPVACAVSVARRGELCARCAAGGVGLLELLPDRGSR